MEGGASHGTIDATGLYQAPLTLPTPPTATIRASSQADPSRSGSATVELTEQSGGPISSEEKRLSQQTFGAAHEAAEFANRGRHDRRRGGLGRFGVERSGPP